MIELRILGSLQLRASDGGRAGALGRQTKRAALLAYLAAAVPRGLHRRDTLLALFWPESSTAHARAALSQALHVLRAELGDGAIVAEGDDLVGLASDAVWCDAVAFEAALDADRPRDALGFYRGDLLEGLHVSEAPGFERWLERERARLRERASAGAWAVAEERAQARDVVEAAAWARRAAELQPADEVAARRHMAFLSRLGDRAAAIRVFGEFARQLAQEYELEPTAETRALVAAIREGEPAAPGRPELTPAAPGPSAGPGARRSRVVPIVLAAVATAVAAAYGVTRHTSHALAAASRSPRILVLPFQNLGAAADGYFADGITDEITTRLAMVPGLSVLGGQAAMRYRGTDKTPRELGAETGADYVLQGSVTWQRASRGAVTIRLRPQLINTRDQTQVWATVLEEHTSDLFPLLSGVAQRVVRELPVVLDASQQRALVAAPTKDPEAYDDYVRGLGLSRSTWSVGNTLAAIRMFERAVGRDSGFAPAFARLGYAHAAAYWLNNLGREHLDRAREADERALRLAPTLPEAHLAMGQYFYACCADYEHAMEHLTAAEATRPNDAQIALLLGNVYKRRGDWEDATRYYQRATDLDPGWDAPLLNLSQLQLWLRHYDEAERVSRRALAVAPREAFAYAILGYSFLLRSGDIAAAWRVMNDAATLSDGYEGMELPFYLKLLERDYRGALALSHGKAPPGGGWDEWIASDHGRRALASRLLGDSAAARDQFDSSRTELEAQLRAGRQRSPRDYDLTASVLAIADAGLGRRSEARALAQEVLASDPPSVDAIAGPLVLQNVAYSYVLLGEPTKALDIIERILAMPAAVSRPLLRLDPRWETLRGNPRFQRLVRDGT